MTSAASFAVAWTVFIAVPAVLFGLLNVRAERATMNGEEGLASAVFALLSFMLAGIVSFIGTAIGLVFWKRLDPVGRRYWYADIVMFLALGVAFYLTRSAQ